MKTGKKILCSFLVALMVLTSAPLGGFVGLEMPDFFNALAAEESANQYLTSGYCGDTTDGGSAKDIAWSLDDSGVLTVTGVGKIAPKAFAYDNRIKEVVISDGILNVSSYCFSDCDNLTKVTMGDDVKSVDEYAFYFCKGLTSIAFPDSLETIGSWAFFGCYGLTSIAFPDSLKTIDSWAFGGCYGLTSIQLPKCLTKINNSIFGSCGFTELTLPDHIQSFDNQYWLKLQNLTIENRYCEYTGTVSPGFKSDCTIRAYCGSPGHELAVKQLYNFESLGHTYLDWYTYAPATYTSDGIERRDCAYCGGYEERAIPKLQNDIFTATFVADGNVVATVDFPKGTTQIAEPQVPAKDRYMGEWESYTLSDSDITINALYTLIKSADASEIETSSETVNYADYDDVLFKLKAWAKAKTVKSTVSKAVPLDIVLVLDQSGSMANTLGGTVKKVDALKSTAKEFIGTVYDNAKLTGADHRISVVGFGLSGNYQGYEKNENTELLTSNRGIVKYDNIKKSDYASSLLNVNVNGSVNDKLISAVDSIDARGATAADLGFEMAKGIFANTNSDNRQRVVIFMTDGEPTYSSSFETSVANSAIANASVLKNAYKASIYSVGVFSDYDSRNTYIKTFMNAVSSGYPDAMSMNYLGKGVDGQYYMTVSNTDSLSGVFKSISTESLSHTAPFENVTIIKTLSKYVTLTSQQEKQLRIDLIRAYGITDDDIVITRNDDGTTEIKISSLTPYEVTDDEGNVTYEVAFEFFASLNENAAVKGDYVVDTEDSGVMLGDDALGYEATFDTSTVTLDNKKTRVIFTINGEIYYISEKLSNGYAVAPEMNLADDWQFSGWDTSSKKATNGTAFDATLVKANRTIIWHTAQGDITQSYVEGDYIVLPTVEPYNSNGDLFLSWNKSIPTTMPDENLEFTAVYGGHVHKYSSAVTKEMTCLTDGIRTFTCSCGDTYDETITATGHNYEAITPSLDKADAKCTFCCTYCGDKYDYALDYEVVSASNKKFNVVYEFKLTDEELNAEMQPDGDIKIRIPLSELHSKADRVVVIRTNPDGSKTIVPATIEKGCLVITCDHFTPYEVVFDVPCEKHSQGDWVVTKKATCTEKGSKYADCTECEKKVAEEEIEKIPHDYNSVVTPPTCTAKGYTTYTCTVCGDSYTGDEVNALNHDMSKFVTTKAPTCTEDGISTSTCSRCDYCKTKELSPKGHNFEGGVCTACGAEKDESCSCNCHKGGISGFFFKIILFLQRIFGINKICSCGAAHY